MEKKSMCCTYCGGDVKSFIKITDRIFKCGYCCQYLVKNEKSVHGYDTIDEKKVEEELAK